MTTTADRVAYILDLAYRAATEHREYWSINGQYTYPHARLWLDSDSYAALKRAVEHLAETQRSSHAGEPNEKGSGA